MKLTICKTNIYNYINYLFVFSVETSLMLISLVLHKEPQPFMGFGRFEREMVESFSLVPATNQNYTALL